MIRGTEKGVGKGPYATFADALAWPIAGPLAPASPHLPAYQPETRTACDRPQLRHYANLTPLPSAEAIAGLRHGVI
jgi:hypothetical protein